MENEIIVPIQIENKIKNALNNSDLTGALRIIRDNALKSKLEQVTKIRQITEIDKYRLVFIGAIGSGKTTAISHLFNLLDVQKINKFNNKLKKQIEGNSVIELMTVGSGGTTIAEVILKSTDSEKSFFEIEFLPKTEIDAFVDDFCDRIITKDEEIQTANKVIPQEIERALRNILNLRPTNEGNPEIEIFKNSLNPDDFKKKIQQRMNITVKEFEVVNFNPENSLIKEEKSQIKEEKIWIKNFFTDLNVANIQGYSIPKRITLYVSNNILGDNNILKNFHSVIDTKGLDAARDRKDIEEYIQNEDTICIFTTKYDNAPDNNITYLISNYLQNDLKSTHNRFITLFLPRGDEPEKKIAYDGRPFGDWEKGIEFTKKHILNTFVGEKIKFNDKNVLHYDAQQFLEDTIYKPEYEDDISKDKRRIIERIEEIIAYRQKMDDVLRNFNASVDTIINKQLSPDIAEKINKTIVELKSYQYLIVDNNFSDTFLTEFDTQFHHWATKHAINKRHGIWEWREIDLIHMAKTLAEKIVRNFSFDYKNRLLTLIKSLKDENSESVFNTIAEQFEFSFLTAYNRFALKISEIVKDRLNSTEFNYSSILWSNTINEYGKGSGFVGRVFSHYTNTLYPIKSIIKKEMENNWKALVIKPLLEFLGEK